MRNFVVFTVISDFRFHYLTARSPNLGLVPKSWTTAIFEGHFSSNDCNS
jgi:hypothetical protein